MFLQSLFATLISMAIIAVAGLIPIGSGNTSTSFGLAMIMAVFYSPVIFIVSLAIEAIRKQVPSFRNKKYVTFVVIAALTIVFLAMMFSGLK